MLGGCPLVFKSKLQTEIALSTLEAEYIALSQSMRELLPLRRLLKEVGEKMKLDFVKSGTLKSTVFEDNNGALGLATSPKLTPRTKHIAVKYHFFRSHISEKEGDNKHVTIKRVDTKEQITDIFTKGLNADSFAYIRNS